eukprot:TRINITY_DN30296_c0_g1_i1.p1 TRINITY_DN30296_c0_g1~~TRINITY_DN30296_c0_g1_i1.p1  ORF type:complete len:417 (-),score=36.08 TRINITY_DN30296_c0_g1_i1:187-1374(-)
MGADIFPRQESTEASLQDHTEAGGQSKRRRPMPTQKATNGNDEDRSCGCEQAAGHVADAMGRLLGHQIGAERRHGAVRRGLKRRTAGADQHWNVMPCVPAGWRQDEVRPEPPSTEACFASLLHGDSREYFAYACVLGRRLREASPGFDRVLLCGPGHSTGNVAYRNALREAGWSRLVPVAPIAAPHLDKSRTKRHALVFTKLRVLELPYSRVLLLDLDLLPRRGWHLGDLFDLVAPAATYYCNRYMGPEPIHGELLPAELTTEYRWCPNAGVMRLDPLPMLSDRLKQVRGMIGEISKRKVPTYLPEQYYLADCLCEWRHLDRRWNWEVWPEWEDPGYTLPLQAARESSRLSGWAGYYDKRTLVTPHASQGGSNSDPTRPERRQRAEFRCHFRADS